MDTGEWRPADEVATGRDIDKRDSPQSSRLATAISQWRQYATVHGRRTAVFGLTVAFVLLLVSQLLPWADVRTAVGRDAGANFTIGLHDDATAVVLTYQLIWVVVLALASATVFASGRARQPLFGAAAGAIAVQFVAIVPLLRHPKGLVGDSVTEFAATTNATELVVTREPGMFCAVAALVVLAASIVFALEGNVVPWSPAEAEQAHPMGTRAPAPDAPEPHLEVLPEQSVDVDGSQPAELAPDASRPSYGRPDVVAFTVQSVEGLPDKPDATPTAPAKTTTDHSAYARPLGNDQYRR